MSNRGARYRAAALNLLFEKFLENRIACVFRWSLAALFRLGEPEDSAPT